MSILAASGLGGFGWLLLALACPLMMIFMMRGMHGHGHGGRGHAGHGTGTPRSRQTMSTDELKRERDELDALIGERGDEAVEAER